MALLLIADSQVQRVWNQVWANRELLRTSTNVLVKNFDHVEAAYKSIKPNVSYNFKIKLLFYVLLLQVYTAYHKFNVLFLHHNFMLYRFKSILPTVSYNSKFKS